LNAAFDSAGGVAVDATVNASAATDFEWHGAADAPAVALIHGLGLDRRMWREFVADLRADYRVLSYDLFGHGGSAPPPAAPSLALFAAQLRGLLDAARVDSCAVVGFSLGGMICRRFAMDCPARARALGVFNSPHARDRAAQLEAESRAAATAAGDIESTVEAALERWFTPQFRAARPEFIAATRAQLLANDRSVYAACRRVLAEGVAELIRPQPPLACPALVMTCAEDRGNSPVMARAIAGEMPGAECIIVPGLRHLGLVESPAEFIAPLRRLLLATARSAPA